MSQSTTLKAEESYRYDYWFTSEAIYRVTIISYAFALVPFIGAYVLVGLGSEFLPPGLWLVFFVAAFALGYFVLKRMASGKRKSIGSPPLKEVLDNQKIARKIPWEEVKSIFLTRKRNIRMLVGIHAYRGNFKAQEYEALRAFLSSKIGDKLQIREGAF